MVCSKTGSSKRMFFSLDVHQQHIRFWLSRYFLWKVSLINIYTSIPSSQTHLTPFFAKKNKSQQTLLDDTLWRCKNLISCQERAGCFLEQCCCCSCCSFSSCSKCPEKCKTSHLGRSWSVGLGCWCWGVDVGGKSPLGLKKELFFVETNKNGRWRILVRKWQGGACQNPVTVGKKSSHFCEGKPINLHYPPNTYTNYHVFPPKVLGKTIFPFFWKVEISKQQLQ